ncbi:MAG TPA: SRPBCC family protein [Methylomirabilota bacterium]|nr:SRPBCC family protein [Methylomirabilota bacterium]
MPLFEEEFTVSAPPNAVWDFLLDPKRVAPCLPGCEGVEVEDARTYRVRLTVKVGFLSTTQNLRVEIVESDRPRRLVSLARGEDRKLASQVEVRNTLDLAPAAANATLVRYRSDVRVLGRLGSVGDAVMKVKAKQLAGDFAANVRAAIERPA